MHAHYRPADDVLDRLNQVDFVAVVGPTASGKTTLIKAAMQREPNLHLVLSSVSRKPRPGEQDGVDYFFKTKAEMEARIDKREYVQVAPSVLGNLYASAPEDYAIDGVAVMTPIAQIMPELRALPFRTFRTIFIVPPSWEVWQQRLSRHNFSPKQLKKRLAEAKASLKFALQDAQTRFVINDSLEQASQDFVILAYGRPLSDQLEADQQRALAIVRNLLDEL